MLALFPFRDAPQSVKSQGVRGTGPLTTPGQSKYQSHFSNNDDQGLLQFTLNQNNTPPRWNIEYLALQANCLAYRLPIEYHESVLLEMSRQKTCHWSDRMSFQRLELYRTCWSRKLDETRLSFHW